MADVTYTPTYAAWHDSPAKDTPVTAEALNTVDLGIAAATNQANTALQVANAAQTTASSALPALTTAAAAQATADAAIPKTQKGAPSGVASLGADGKVPAAQLSADATAAKLAGTLRFFVEDFGAVGDGVTDDTTAIRNCVTAAFNAALAAASHYAEIRLQAKVYLVNGAPVTGGTTHGNAIIPLPVQPTTAPKITLVFKGPGPVDALPHWKQTGSPVVGATLKTTRTDGTNDGANGPASVVGGPTIAAGWGAGFNTPWNNVHVVIDGVSINVPVDPTYCGFDFQGCGEASVVNGSAFSNHAPGDVGYSETITHQWTYGLAMPVVNNNALCNVGSWSCEGFCYGFMPSEHTVAVSVRAIYCITGIEWYSGPANMPHAGIIHYAAVEACGNAVGFYPGGATKFRILMLDVEALGKLIYDPNNLGIGEIYKTGDDLDPGSTVNGGKFVRVIEGNRVGGSYTAPAVPASNTPLVNPVFRDAAVHVSGGAVTAIKVDGVTLGVTSGLVFLPTGKTVTLTYTAAPTWVWTLL